MFRRRAEIREHLLETIEKFRKKGALSPEKAMTAEELGLPAEFKDRMKRRLGQLGVFVEVDGKYYLSEERLKEVKEKISERRRRW
jgi:lipoate-protein ligase A